MEFKKYKIGNREYSIYSNGVVKYGDKEITQNKDKDGYLVLSLWDDIYKRQERRRVHRLVAELFIPNPLNKKEVNHIDRDRSNNRVENLEWVTRKENIKHSKEAYSLSRIGSKNGRTKLTEDDVLKIRKMHDEGVAKYLIAKSFNIGWSTVDHIIKRETWKHI